MILLILFILFDEIIFTERNGGSEDIVIGDYQTKLLLLERLGLACIHRVHNNVHKI